MLITLIKAYEPMRADPNIAVYSTYFMNKIATIIAKKTMVNHNTRRGFEFPTIFKTTP